jgi:hypothetical protein
VGLARWHGGRQWGGGWNSARSPQRALLVLGECTGQRGGGGGSPRWCSNDEAAAVRRRWGAPLAGGVRGEDYSKERRRGRGGARSTGSMATFPRNSGEAGGSPAPTMDEMKRGEHGGCHAALWWRRKEGGEKSWAAVTDAF